MSVAVHSIHGNARRNRSNGTVLHPHRRRIVRKVGLMPDTLPLVVVAVAVIPPRETLRACVNPTSFAAIPLPIHDELEIEPWLVLGL